MFEGNICKVAQSMIPVVSMVKPDNNLDFDIDLCLQELNEKFDKMLDDASNYNRLLSDPNTIANILKCIMMAK